MTCRQRVINYTASASNRILIDINVEHDINEFKMTTNRSLLKSSEVSKIKFI